MKYVAAGLLLVLSGLLGIVVALNVYFALATAGNRQLSAATKPSFPMLGAFALAAIVSFAGAIAIASNRQEKS